MSGNPFEALGLPARRDLTDEQVRAAWRKIAAATHPDRRDGGDVARYTAATAAYAVLRTAWGRSEAYADLAGAGERTAPQPAAAGDGGAQPAGDGGALPEAAWWRGPGLRAGWRPAGGPSAAGWYLLGLAVQLPARIRYGRPLRLAVRAAVTAAASLAVLAAVPGQPASVCLAAALLAWFAVTGRSDLAPPRDRDRPR